MLVQTRDSVDIAARAREFGCRVPIGIALLPGNFSTAADMGEFCYHAAALHVRSAWQDVGLEDEGPDCEAGTRDSGLGTSSRARTPIPNPQPPVPFSCDVPLVVFFGPGLLAGPPWRLVVALGMVSSVLASQARRASQGGVRLDIVVERPRDHGCARIEYQGDAFGIVALAREVRRVWTGK